MNDRKPDEDRDRVEKRILTEQFWFTAITLAINGFLISCHKDNTYAVTVFVVTGSSIITLFAIYLIVLRWVDYVGKRKTPKCYKKGESKQKDTQLWRYKRAEASCDLKSVYRYLWAAICECSGSGFCLLLVFLSCVAVWVF